MNKQLNMHLNMVPVMWLTWFSLILLGIGRCSKVEKNTIYVEKKRIEIIKKLSKLSFVLWVDDGTLGVKLSYSIFIYCPNQHRQAHMHYFWVGDCNLISLGLLLS